MLGGLYAHAQMAVVAPSTDMQLALNHAEQIQSMAQSYQTMVGVKEGIDKGIDAMEKINNKLTTIREVQDIGIRSAACIRKLQRIYNMISAMELDTRYTTGLLEMCNQTVRDCVNVTAYGTKVFAPGFLKMNDADRLAETRQVLDKVDKLLGRANFIDSQARAIDFNQKMLKSYVR